ncbi:MAG: GGDEF domain-containing protein [Chloroflexota bacterium]
MGSEPVVVLAIIDAVVVGMFFLFRVLPWSKPGPWRLIWINASLAFGLFSLGETSAIMQGGSAVSLEVQGPMFGAILATTTCLIFVYIHGVRLSEQALTLALTDDLTSLASSRAFSARLEFQLREPAAFSVAYINLQGLGAVNDLFGAHRGDKLLKAFADLLRANAGSGDFIGRLGGDQFAMVLAGPEERAAEVTERIQTAFRQLGPREAAGVDLVASIGVVPRTEASDPGRLMRLAYRAMQEAKRAGENRSATPSAD